MKGCFNCKKRYGCIKSECFDSEYQDNPYVGSECTEHEYEEEDKNMVEITEPSEALNDSLKALCRFFDEIQAKRRNNLSDAEYCLECEHRNSCAEWIGNTSNDYYWREKVQKCREKEEKSGD